MSDAAFRPGLYRFALASLVVTILLTIGIGGTITSAEVGMAYPTWPDINGGSLFNIFYDQLAEAFGWGSVIEHTHRQAGALAGLLVLITAALGIRARPNSNVRHIPSWPTPPDTAV